jgi:hypothetical protein
MAGIFLCERRYLITPPTKVWQVVCVPFLLKRSKSQFGFCRRCHDVLDDVCNVEDGVIVRWNVGGGREEEVAASATAGFLFGKIA